MDFYGSMDFLHPHPLILTEAHRRLASWPGSRAAEVFVAPPKQSGANLLRSSAVERQQRIAEEKPFVQPAIGLVDEVLQTTITIALGNENLTSHFHEHSKTSWNHPVPLTGHFPCSGRPPMTVLRLNELPESVEELLMTLGA